MNIFIDEKSKLFLDLGINSCMEGDFEKGLKYFNTGLDINQDNILLLYNKASCLMEMGEAEKAKPLFKKIINLCEGMEKNLFFLQIKANSYIYLEDFENTRIVLEDLLKISPDNVNAFINIGQILKKEFHYEEAISYFDKALEIDNQNCEALMFKGESLLNLFRYDEAKEYIDRAFEISKDFPYVWYLKGRCESQMENYEAAVEYYDKATEMQPDFEKAYYDKAICLMILGKTEEAKAAFNIIFDLNPEKYEDSRRDLSGAIVDHISHVFSKN